MFSKHCRIQRTISVQVPHVLKLRQRMDTACRRSPCVLAASRAGTDDRWARCTVHHLSVYAAGPVSTCCPPCGEGGVAGLMPGHALLPWYGVKRSPSRGRWVLCNGRGRRKAIGHRSTEETNKSSTPIANV